MNMEMPQRFEAVLSQRGYIYIAEDEEADASFAFLTRLVFPPHYISTRCWFLLSPRLHSSITSVYLSMSSPGAYDLPPSSAPIDPGTPQSQSLGQSNFDPLAFDNVPGLNGTLPGQGRGDGGVEDTETGNAPRRGGGRRARLEDTADIPRVKDATGEKVMESFSLFLEK